MLYKSGAFSGFNPLNRFDSKIFKPHLNFRTKIKRSRLEFSDCRDSGLLILLRHQLAANILRY